MANSSAKSAVFFSLIVMLSFLLIVSTVESSRSLLGSTKATAAVECDTVYGAAKDDTCFAVAQMFNLTTEFFDSINPNLNCDKVFVGQWLCVDGSA